MNSDDNPQGTRSRLNSPFLNTRQAAHWIGLSARHLERMRRTGDGPPFRRHGRFVFYHIDELEAWSRSTGKQGSHD